MFNLLSRYNNLDKVGQERYRAIFNALNANVTTLSYEMGTDLLGNAICPILGIKVPSLKEKKEYTQQANNLINSIQSGSKAAESKVSVFRNSLAALNNSMTSEYSLSKGETINERGHTFVSVSFKFKGKVETIVMSKEAEKAFLELGNTLNFPINMKEVYVEPKKERGVTIGDLFPDLNKLFDVKG